jgi:hypothetical protein
MIATDFIQVRKIKPRRRIVENACVSAPLSQREITIETPLALSHIRRVKVTTKRHAKSEAELLDQGTNNLLRAVKQKIVKKEGRVDYDKLRKEGYSDRFLAKVEAA